LLLWQLLPFTPILSDFLANETEICELATVSFTDESENATSWEWDFGADANPGTYQLSLTASQFNCSDDTIQEIIVPMVGIEEYNNGELVRIFPNPNNGKFKVEIKNFKEVEKISLLDLSGQTIKSISKNSINNSMISLELESIKSGIYFLEINTKTDKIVKRVLIK